MGRGFQFACLMSALVWDCALAKSQRAMIPSHQQIAISERAQDCGMMNSLSRRFESAARGLEEEMAEATSVVNGLFARVEQCAKNHGLSFKDERATAQEEIAMSCPSEYEEWVQYSYRVMMLEEERESTLAKRDEASRFLASCPAIRN